MTCMTCGHEMTTKRETVPYTALPGTVIGGVEVSRCPHCGEFEVAIPAIDQLNRLLATRIINQTRRLSGPEFRFLRSYLGYSSADFAELIGADPSSVSRWENGRQVIGRSVDLLLRTMLAHDKRVDDYQIADLRKVTNAQPSKAKRKKPEYAFKHSASAWRSDVTV